MPKEKILSLSDAVNLIKDGDHVAFGGVLVQNKPMAFIWELLKPENRKQDLTISVLTGNFGVDAILALMNIKELNTIYCGLETAGFAPNFQRLVEEGNLKVNEFTEMQFFWAMRASEMGLPYLPCRSGIDSELIDVNPYLKAHEFEGENLVAVKALEPDVTVVHCMVGDAYGNIQNEEMKTYMSDTISRAVKKGGKAIVCVEKLASSEYIYENSMNTILNSFEVDAVVEVPYGAHPGSVKPLYFYDMAFQMTFGNALKKVKRLERFLTKSIFPFTREQYLEKYKLKVGEWWNKK
ncbi:MAG: CoA transferase subunit A [Candidatus Helarchaeota archaeon]